MSCSARRTMMSATPPCELRTHCVATHDSFSLITSAWPIAIHVSRWNDSCSSVDEVIAELRAAAATT